MEALQALERDIEATEALLARQMKARDILDPHTGELHNNGGDPEERDEPGEPTGGRFQRDEEPGSLAERYREHVYGLTPESEFTVRGAADAIGADAANQFYKMTDELVEQGFLKKTRKKDRNATVYRRTDKQFATTAS